MEAIYIRVYKKKVHPSPHIELRKKNPIKMDKKERGETSRNRIKTQPKKKNYSGCVHVMMLCCRKHKNHVANERSGGH